MKPETADEAIPTSVSASRCSSVTWSRQCWPPLFPGPLKLTPPYVQSSMISTPLRMSSDMLPQKQQHQATTANASQPSQKQSFCVQFSFKYDYCEVVSKANMSLCKFAISLPWAIDFSTQNNYLTSLTLLCTCVPKIFSSHTSDSAHADIYIFFARAPAYIHTRTYVAHMHIVCKGVHAPEMKWATGCL